MLKFFKLLSLSSPSHEARRAILWLVLLSIGLVLFASELPLRLNFTASMPRGIYLLHSHPEVQLGDFVMVCLPKQLSKFARQRGYLRAGSCANGVQPLLKEVVALGGDYVFISTNSVKINGIVLPHSSTLPLDNHGRLLPTIPLGSYLLNEHELWLYGTDSAQSWDSRYFGAVDLSTVIHVVKPLLTFNSSKQS